MRVSFGGSVVMIDSLAGIGGLVWSSSSNIEPKDY